ncbi:MAG: hypothetical protein ACP5DX_01055 [Paracoccaceae bacterium]
MHDHARRDWRLRFVAGLLALTLSPAQAAATGNGGSSDRGAEVLSETRHISRPADPIPGADAAQPPGTAASGWTVYSNTRYGTTIRYPRSHFRPADEAPVNADGCRFTSPDGQAEMRVWAEHNTLRRTVTEMRTEILETHPAARILDQSRGDHWFTLKLDLGTAILYRRSRLDNANRIHNIEIRYPAAQAGRFDAVAELVVHSLRRPAVAPPPAPPNVSRPAAPGAPPSPAEPGGGHPGGAQMELAFWQSIAGSDDPAMYEAYLAQWPEGTFASLARLQIERLTGAGAAGQEAEARYYTPARGSAERRAIMDAARLPVQRELGQQVIFLVSELRCDGAWCYLEAEPLTPDGGKLDWSATPYAEDWAHDMMSELVMVLLRRRDGGWQAVDYVIGPTDVFWYNWVDGYGLPERLFTPGE